MLTMWCKPDPHYMVIGLLIVSYIILICLVYFLSIMENSTGQKFFRDSPFFTSGYKFSMFSIDFENKHYFNVLCFFFFINSFIFNLNLSVINPLFQRLIFNKKVEVDAQTQGYLSFVLFVYDVWSVFRSFFAIVGMVSNVWFFVWNSVGFLAGDLLIRNLYIKYPDSFKFDYSGPVKIHTVQVTNNQMKTSSLFIY